MVEVEGATVGQAAKIRSDPAGGFVVATTGWGEVGGEEVNVVVLVKLSAGLSSEWNHIDGMIGGHSQVILCISEN